LLSPEELQRADEDEDWLPNAIGAEGRSVLTVGSDSSMPGGCGVMWISEWRGLYFFQSSDVDSEGPFANLEDALEVDYFTTFTSNNEIWSEVIPTDQLLQIVSERFSDNFGNTIEVNDRAYETTETGLVRQCDCGANK
jgi:hypothetical protein